MRLDVHVRGKKVAQIYRQQDDYLLRYLDSAQPTDFVSLTMPVRQEPWRWPRDLHPFFRQNLPEGYLLSIIREEFGPFLDGTDLSLLAVVGAAGVGRVTVTPEGAEPGADLAPLQVEPLLRAENTSTYFVSLVRQYARASVSGMVPKFLSHENTSGNLNGQLGKSTLRTQRYIIKGSDETTPYLGFNEFYSMRVLSRLGVVPVAQTQMSGDGQLLVVKRFDVNEDGVATHGLEDACGLLGLPPHEKYASTTEKILTACLTYLPVSQKHHQLEQLGWHLLTNYVVRNADCHAKNIALVYTGLNDVAFSPVYDIVTTGAYPRYANHPPGLAIDGRKTWAPGKTLERFFNARLGIAPLQYSKMVERLCESAVEVGSEVIAAAKNEPRWHSVAKQMVHAWNEGMSSLRDPKKSPKYHGLIQAITAAGLSDPEPADAERVTIGRSELLAAPRGKPKRNRSRPS